MTLVSALEGTSGGLVDLHDRLEGFEAARRPAVERLQDRARRSQLWWESVGARLHLSPARFAAAFMSRAGAVSLEDLAGSEPDVTARAVADYADVPRDAVPARYLVDWVLQRPLIAPGGSFSSRRYNWDDPDRPRVAIEISVERGADPWGQRGDAAVLRTRALGSTPAGVVLLAGADDRDSVLDRLALGDRLRSETSALVMASVRPELLDDAAIALVSGRIDLALTGARS